MRYKGVVARVLFIENHDSFSWNVLEALPFDRSEIEVTGAAEAWAALDQAELVVLLLVVLVERVPLLQV